MFLLQLPLFLLVLSAVDSLYGECFNVPDTLSHLTPLSLQHVLLVPMKAPHQHINQQPTVSFFSFFFACSHSHAIITMQVCPFINVISQIPCDLVAPRLGPMIRAKFLSLSGHRPMHNGS